VETEVASAAAATIIATAFALALFDRWLLYGRRHVLSWLVSMVIFAGASAALWVGAAFGWETASFKLFYLLGGVLSVPPLGLGTMYLLGSQKLADQLAIATAVFSIFAIGVLTAAPVTAAALGSSGIPNGADVFSGLPRALAALGSTIGSLVVLGGAIYSLLKLSPKRRLLEDVKAQSQSQRRAVGGRTARGRIAGGTSLVALGTLMLGTGGLLNSIADEMTAFALSLAIGAALLFAGFMVSTTQPATADTAKVNTPTSRA